MSPDKRKHDVFISYSTKNSDVANKICHILEQNDLKCWIAPRNISSGRNYIDEIASGIKSTKIVVLVYSKYSQMEYHLKITQWLPAYPNPEDEFETLIIDALKLCDETTDKPILMDFTNYKPEDLTKHKKDYISLVLLFTPFYWTSFIYMGINTGKKLWALMGFVYSIPTLMCLIIYFGILDMLFLLYPMLVLFSLIFIMFWILAIIHGFVIRNEFLTRKSVLRFTSSNEEIFEYLYDEYMQI